MKQQLIDFWNNRVGKYGIFLFAAFYALFSNVYRLFPSAECEPPKSGDLIAYNGFYLTWLMVSSYILYRGVSTVEYAIMGGIFSMLLNDLSELYFGDPHSIQAYEVFFNAIITFSVCRVLKIDWLVSCLIIAVVIGLNMI